MLDYHAFTHIHVHVHVAITKTLKGLFEGRALHNYYYYYYYYYLIIIKTKARIIKKNKIDIKIIKRIEGKPLLLLLLLLLFLNIFRCCIIIIIGIRGIQEKKVVAQDTITVTRCIRCVCSKDKCTLSSGTYTSTGEDVV